MDGEGPIQRLKYRHFRPRYLAGAGRFAWKNKERKERGVLEVNRRRSGSKTNK